MMAKKFSSLKLTALLCGFLVLVFGLFPNAGISKKSGKAAEELYSENYVHRICTKFSEACANISEDVFALAIKGFSKLHAQKKLSEDSILSIIDFTKSSKEKRMYVIDLKSQTLKYQTVVAHGKNTGEEYAKYFSNQPRSHKSSLGFYITGSTYNGNNGYSLKLKGVEKGFNDHAESRAIVVHGAVYAEEWMSNVQHFLGRSFGCPALPMSAHQKIIETIKGGNCLFIYFPDQKYLSNSPLLNG